MHTFEITIEEGKGEASRVLIDHAAGGFAVASRLESTILLTPADREALAHAIRPDDYGTILGKALFTGEVASRFRDAITAANSGAAPEPLRVMLSVNDLALQHLRWERLCAPFGQNWRHLALSQGSPLSLTISSVTNRQYAPIALQDLSAIIFVAKPDGVAPFEVEDTVTGVCGALGESIPHKVIASGRDGTRPTLDELVTHLTAHAPTFLHIVCHGQMRNGQVALFFEKADGSKAIVTDDQFLEALARLRRPPHFTFLSACESAASEEGEAYSGLGQRLVREFGMLAVVAMTDVVSVKTATELSKAFYAQLRTHGELDLALVEATAGLARQQDVLVPVLFSRLDGHPLFDTAAQPLKELSGKAIGSGLDRLRCELQRRAPVLLDQLEVQEQILRPILGTDAESLAAGAKQDRSDALDVINAMSLEALELSFAALALKQDPPEYDDRQPFRGDQPFRYEDRHFFSGRDDLIQRLVGRLATDRVLTVIGPSGSGKTSVVLAGLIPALEKVEPGLRWASFVPGATPQVGLDLALSTLPDQSGVLIIDRFESLFLGGAPAAERSAFITRIVGEMQSRRVVLTMRPDCLELCREHPELLHAMGGRTVVVPPLNTDALRVVIGHQAAATRLSFEAELAETILNDAAGAGEPGEMALIQSVLLELWNRRHGRNLRTCEYVSLGRVRRMIVDRADRLFRELTPEEQAQVQAIFIRLTHLHDDSGPGEASRDDRRRVPLPDLVPVGGDPLVTRALVHRLADAGLVVVS